MLSRIAVIIPIYGRDDLTRAVLDDLAMESGFFDVWLVDNLGTFTPGRGPAEIVSPGTNLRWSGGCNYGLAAACERDYDAFLLLNNDVRLSPSFMRGLLDAANVTSGDVIGPLYDHNWPHQRGAYQAPATGYRARARDYAAPFVDGTCMLIRRSILDRIGFLDEHHWPMYGWGCDKDLALRCRGAGGTIWVTERSYLNHFGRQTALQLVGYSELAAERENDLGMSAKWGADWRELLYEGFGNVSRLGFVQERVQRMNRPS